jgi:hypothetical protein
VHHLGVLPLGRVRAVFLCALFGCVASWSCACCVSVFTIWVCCLLVVCVLCFCVHCTLHRPKVLEARTSNECVRLKWKRGHEVA